MFFFLVLSVLSFVYYFFSSRELKTYDNIVVQNVRLLSFYKSETIAPGSSMKEQKIQWYNLNVEIPLEDLSSKTVVTISTTDRRARRYRKKDYIDVYILNKAPGRVSGNIYIKEDLKTPAKNFLSLLLGSVFMAIFLFCAYITWI